MRIINANRLPRLMNPVHLITLVETIAAIAAAIVFLLKKR